MTGLDSQLQLEQARYAAILAASLDAIVVMDHEGRFVEFNPAATAIFGYTREDVIGRPIADFIIPHHLRERHRQGLARYLAVGSGPVVNQRIELPALRANGEEFPVEIAIVPVRGQGPPLFVGFIRDITEAKNAEQRRQLLIRESAHRIRNLLTVIQSIVTLTLTDGRPVSEARHIVLRRISALARSHAMLAAGETAGAPLARIIAEEIEGFSDRIDAKGPDLAVNAASAQTFGLIVHELATNAAKHGALSAAGGRITVRWSIEDAAGEPSFMFEWSEHGGPPAAASPRAGFGRAVLEQVAMHDFKSAPRIEFTPDGLRYSLSIPLAVLTKSRSP
jgi:PAS domain S-box-containing protein